MKIRSLKAGAGWVWAVLGAMLLGLMLLAPAEAGAVSLTSVRGTVYRADGTPASGSLIVTWPGFSTSMNEAVAAGSLAITIGADGYLQVALAPNQGAFPEGSYYTAVYHLSDGTVSREFWVVPAAAQAAVASVRAVVAPANVATQSVSKTYVDSAVAGIGNNYVPVSGGAMNGPLTLSGDPTSSAQAANKHYADSAASAAAAVAVPLAGGAMSGALTLNADPVLGTSSGSAAVTLNWANRWPCNSANASGTRGFQSYVDITCYGAVGDSLMLAGGLVTHVGSNVILSTGSTTGVFPSVLQGNLLVVGRGGAPYNGNASFPGAALYGYAQMVSDHEVHLFSDKAMTQPANAGSEVGGTVSQISGTSSGGGWTAATCGLSNGDAGLLATANGGSGYATGATCVATIKSGNVSCSLGSVGQFYTSVPTVTVSGNLGSFTNICAAAIAGSGSGYASGLHSATDTAAITSAYNAAKAASLPVYIPPLGSVGLHDTRDSWGYWFGGPALSGWGRPEFAGADEFTSTIIVAPTTYLVDDASPWYSMNVHDVGFFGGVGYFRTRSLSAFDTGHYVVANNSFHGFTGTAFATNQIDNPYWLFEHNTCIAANTWSGICISMGGGNDSTKVEDNHFDNQRVGFKSTGMLSTVRIDRNEWLQFQPETVAGAWSRTGIWLAGGAANDVIAENKWGNENKDQSDVAMLAANSDASNCNDLFAVGLYGSCPASNQLPLTGTQAMFQIRAMHVHSNLVAGAGYTSQPFLYSYTADVERNEFTDFIIDGAALGYVIDVDTATNPTPANFQYTNLCGPYMSQHPSHTLSQTGGSNIPGLCTENELTGVYSSNNAFSMDPNTTGSNQAGFNNLLMVGAAGLTKELTGDGITGITDSQGALGTTAATLTWTTGTHTDYGALTGTITPNEPMWIEMDLRASAGCSGASCLADIYPTITNATGTVTYYGQQFAVPATGTGWKHYRRLMWWPQTGTTGLVFHLAPGPDAPATGGSVDVGLLHVYQAWQPATGSQVLDTLSVTGGAQLGGPVTLSANTKIQPAPGAASGTVFQVPPTNGAAGYVLTTDGTGSTQWAPSTAASAVSLAGGAMSGALTLNGDPTMPMMAATKNYVDGHSGLISGLNSDGASGIAVTGAVTSSVVNGTLNESVGFTGSTVAGRVQTACASLAGSFGTVVIPATETATDAGFSGLPDGCVVNDLRGSIYPNYTGSYNVLGGAQKANNLLYWKQVGNAAGSVTNPTLMQLHLEPNAGGLNTWNGSTGTKTNYQNLYLTQVARTPGQHSLLDAGLSSYSNGDAYAQLLLVNCYGQMTGAGDEACEGTSEVMTAGFPALTATISAISGNTLTMTCGTNCRQLGEQQPLLNTTRGEYAAGTIASIAGAPPVITGTGTAWASLCPGGTSPCSPTNLWFEFTAETVNNVHLAMPVVAISDNTHATLSLNALQINDTYGGNISSGAYTIYQGSAITAVPYTAGSYATIYAAVNDASQFQVGDSVLGTNTTQTQVRGLHVGITQNVPYPAATASTFLYGSSGGTFPIYSGVQMVSSAGVNYASYYHNWSSSPFGPQFGVSLIGAAPSVAFFQGSDPANNNLERMLGTQTSTGTNTALTFDRTSGNNWWKLGSTYLTNDGRTSLSSSPQANTAHYESYSNAAWSGLVIAPAVAPNSGVFPLSVGMGGGVAAFYVKGTGSGNVDVAVNNGQMLKGMSGNQSGVTWSLNGATGAGAMTSLTLNGGTPITGQSSANPQVVTCPAGGTGSQYCGADGVWHVIAGSSLSPMMLCRDTTDVPNTGAGSTTEGVRWSCTIPANSMDANATFDYRMMGTAASGNTGTCSFRWSLATTPSAIGVNVGMASGVGNNRSAEMQGRCSTRNTTNAEICGDRFVIPTNATSILSATPALDMTATSYLNLSVVNSAASDSCTVNMAEVILWP